MHVLSRNISNIACHQILSQIPLRTEQQKLGGTRIGNRPKIMHSVRPVANSNLQLFTTSARDRGSFFRRKCRIGRNTSQIVTPVGNSSWSLAGRVYPRWLHREGVARTGGTIFYELSWLARNLSGCHPGIPSVGFSWRARS